MMDMDFAAIVPVLALLTLLAVALFALISKKTTEDRRQDARIPPSSLAKDGNPHREAP